MKKGKGKKILAILMAALMVVGIMPMDWAVKSVSADEIASSSNVITWDAGTILAATTADNGLSINDAWSNNVAADDLTFADGFAVAGNNAKAGKPKAQTAGVNSAGSIPDSGCYVKYVATEDGKITFYTKIGSNKTFYIVGSDESVVSKTNTASASTYDMVVATVKKGQTYYAYLGGATAQVWKVSVTLACTWDATAILAATTANNGLLINDAWSNNVAADDLTFADGFTVAGNNAKAGKPKAQTAGVNSAGTIPDSGCYVKYVAKNDGKITFYTKIGSNKTFYIVGADKTVSKTNTSSASTYDMVTAKVEAGKTYYAYLGGATAQIWKVAYTPITERKAWDEVENPVIKSAKVNTTTGLIDVDVNAEVGDDGADQAVLFMYQNGFEVSSKVIEKSDVYTMTPITEGDFTFKVVMSRSGCADKESASVSLADYILPLATPTISWVNNLGNGSVYVDWNNVSGATFDVAYKLSDGDAEYTTVAEGITKGNYTLTGLEAGKEYTIKVTDKLGELSSYATAEVTVDDAEQQWYTAAIGSATSGKVTIDGTVYDVKTANGVIPVEDVTNTDKKISVEAASNGKIADSEDGFFYYYTKLNPNTENFSLTATFKVTSNAVDNQTGYGIIATDLAGYGNMNAKYFNSVSVGQYKMFGGGYHSNGTRLTTGYTSFDTTSNAGVTRVLDNTNMFNNRNETDAVNVGDEYTFTLQKTNDGYVATMAGDDKTISFSNPASIMVQEDGSICVGIMVARMIGVEISNIKFTKSEGKVEGSSEVTLTKPTVSVYSGTTTGSSDYTFIAKPNVSGQMVITLPSGKEESMHIDAETPIKVPVELVNVGANNQIKYNFRPDTTTENLSSYDAINGNITVRWSQYGKEGETMYVSPEGRSSNKGSKESPLDLQTALSYAQPGQTVVMLNGTYYPTKDYVVGRNVNGTKDKPITLVAETTGKVIIDGSKMTSSSSLITFVGSYWNVFGLELQNGLAKGISVCGNYNTIEMCTIHNVGNSGLQISRYSGEPNALELWPTGNLIKNVEAYDCCDAGRNDADGFAAKLTCGEGNVFYGCISHNNIDDGWDLYAKGTTGQIGKVTIENCIAYSNGFLTSDDPTEKDFPFGEGNGFKLGGENIPGGHELKNSITFNNAGKGITSNSCPDCKVENCTAFNNSLKGKSYNVSLYTKDSNVKGWVLSGMLSVVTNKTTQAEVGASNGVIYSLRSESNYLYDGSVSTNTQGVAATTDWFVSTDVTKLPTRNANGTINMNGLLELNESAPTNAGARLDTASEKAISNVPVIGTNVVSEIKKNPEVTVTIKDETKEVSDAKIDDSAVVKREDGTIVLVEDVQVQVKEATEEVKTAVNEALTGSGVDISLAVGLKYFEIDLTDNTGSVVKLESGKVQITFNVDEKVDLTQYTAVVYHVKDDGSLEKMDAKVTADGIVIVADGFSPYVVMYVPIEEKSDTDTSTGDTTNATPFVIMLLVSAGLVALAAGVYFFDKKRKTVGRR